jgi:hypothetical protein
MFPLLYYVTIYRAPRSIVAILSELIISTLNLLIKLCVVAITVGLLWATSFCDIHNDVQAFIMENGAAGNAESALVGLVFCETLDQYELRFMARCHTVTVDMFVAS